MNHCKTIAIVNQKGGVGKTTSTVNLGVGLAQAGNRVLLVDDDPQHSLTISLGIRNADDDLDTTLATAMQAEIRDESVPWEEGIIHSGEGVDLLPANIELSGVEMSLFNAMSREQVLKSVLSRVKENYDYILIDCMWFLKMSFPPPSSIPHGGSSESAMLFPQQLPRMWNICWILFRPAPCFPTPSLLSC